MNGFCKSLNGRVVRDSCWSMFSRALLVRHPLLQTSTVRLLVSTRVHPIAHTAKRSTRVVTCSSMAKEVTQNQNIVSFLPQRYNY